MHRQPPDLASGDAEQVVDADPGADVRALPAEVGEREQEGNRLDQVRRDPLQQQGPLGERLADQAEIELLKVAQTAVDELARPRRCACAEVPRLDEAYGQAPRYRVNR